MAVVVAVVGIAVLGGIGVVAGWIAWGDPECAREGRHPVAGAPAYCRLPRGHAGRHQYH
jgi:hypothetical protein